MKALDRKLLRDLRLLWSQVLTIALVVASGIGGFLTTLSAVDSLALARDQFYAQGHFADVFASVRRAPLALEQRLLALPGVADVQTTLEQIVRVDSPGASDPIFGQLIGLDRRRPARLNLLTLQRGQWLPEASSGPTIPVLVNAGFARARSIGPGAEFLATLNGKQRRLQVVGVVVSPQFVFAGLSGMPDQRGFGVFWLDRDVLAAAYDMAGAFTRVAVQLAPGAAPQATIAALSAELEPYGSGDVHGRSEQPSHAMLDNEIKEQRVLGTVLPVIFLGVAAFLLNVVVSRLVATQREQIAALKALGYGNGAIAAHYLKLVGLIVLLGLVLGVLLGRLLGTMLTGLYAEFFHFPQFEHVLDPGLVLIGAGISTATAVAGTLGAILASARLAPAEAMRPPAPGRYRPALLERLGWRGIGPAGRMILRQVERRPWRTGLSVAGVAASVAIVVMGNFFRDAIDHIVDTQFNGVLRSDVVLGLMEAAPLSAAAEVARLPGVLQVEAQRNVAARLHFGARSERVALQGLPAQPELLRIIATDGSSHGPGAGGLVLTDRLADKLGAGVGSVVLAEVLDGQRRTLALPVDAVLSQMMGLNAYIEIGALNRALGDDALASQFAVQVQRGSEAALLHASRALPRVSGAFSKSTLLHNMQEVSARNVRIMSTVLTAFAAVIAVGVVYNNARIALAERAWELASLRVLGFSRGEVSFLLLGEMALQLALALPLGMLLGRALVGVIALLMKSDQFLFPVVIQPATYALAALAVLAAALASAAVVRRRIDRLDMVAALKTRE